MELGFWTAIASIGAGMITILAFVLTMVGKLYNIGRDHGVYEERLNKLRQEQDALYAYAHESNHDVRNIINGRFNEIEIKLAKAGLDK